MERAPIEHSAHRRWFLDRVAEGMHTIEAAKALGFSVRAAQRYAAKHAQFKKAYRAAKMQGSRARRNGKRAETPPDPPALPKPKSHAPPLPPRPPKVKTTPKPRPPRPDPPPEVDATGPVYLEQIQMIYSEGLQLNPGLPPLSVQTHLAMLQRQAYEDKRPAVVKEAQRQLGTFVLGPLVLPSLPSRTEVEEQLPKLLLGGAPQVVLMAPDNGLYAPGCGPGQPEIVDGAEAAELVQLPVARGEE